MTTSSCFSFVAQSQTDLKQKINLSKEGRFYPEHGDIKFLQNLIGAITLCYNNIRNLLPSRDTTILVKNMTTNY